MIFEVHPDNMINQIHNSYSYRYFVCFFMLPKQIWRLKLILKGIDEAHESFAFFKPCRLSLNFIWDQHTLRAHSCTGPTKRYLIPISRKKIGHIPKSPDHFSIFPILLVIPSSILFSTESPESSSLEKLYRDIHQ